MTTDNSTVIPQNQCKFSTTHQIVKYLSLASSVYIAVLAIYGSITLKNPSHLLALVFAFFINPLIWEIRFRQNPVWIIAFYEGFKIALLFLGSIIALLVTAKILPSLDSLPLTPENVLNNYEALLKIICYLTYILILLLFINSNKTTKYFIFAGFYCFCMLLSFMTPEMNEKVIWLSNTYIDTTLDKDSYALLQDAILGSIKEAMLTYIIFDTAIDCKLNLFKKETCNKKDLVTNAPSYTTHTNSYDVVLMNEHSEKIRDYKVIIDSRQEEPQSVK